MLKSIIKAYKEYRREFRLMVLFNTVLLVTIIWGSFLARPNFLITALPVFWKTAFAVPIIGIINVLLWNFVIKADIISPFLREKYVKFNQGKINFVVLLACYSLAFMAFYPGLYVFDSVNSIASLYQGENYRSAFPVGQTLLFKFLVFLAKILGNQQLAAAIGCFIQIIIIAAILAYTISIFKNNGYFVWIFLLLFFGLNPIISVMSVIQSPDPLLSAFFTLFVIKVIGFLFFNKQSRPDKVCIILSFILCILFRLNFIYAAVPMVLILFLNFRKTKQLIALLSLGLALAVGLNYQGELFLQNPAMGTVIAQAATTGSQTPITVPPVKELPPGSLLLLQALAGVYVNQSNSLNSTEITEMMEYLPPILKTNKQLFNPRLSDPIVYAGAGIPKAETFQFIQLSFKTFLHFPLTYINAVLTQTQGSWDPLNPLPNAQYTDNAIEVAPSQDRWLQQRTYQLNTKTLNPALFNFYVDLFGNQHIMSLPILNLFMNSGFVFWLLLLAMLLLLIKRNYNWLLVYSFPVFYWATFLLGPVMLFRYNYFLVIMAPLLLLVTLILEDKQKIGFI